MSFILDALRRADADRSRGTVPGLHTPPAPLPARPWTAGPGRRLLGGALLLMLASALGTWLLSTRPTAPAPAPAQPAAVAPPATPAPAAAPVAAPTSTSAAVTAPPPTPGQLAAALPPVPAAASAPPPARPPAVPDPLPLDRLPADERAALPPLVPGGSVHSEMPASRFVILDGQLLREGERVAPGLVVERIEPKRCVLAWRGRRLALAL